MNTVSVNDTSETPVLPAYEKPASISRIFLEVVFYIVVFNCVFEDISPLAKIRYGLGALVALSGSLFLFNLCFVERRLPFSLVMAILITLFVNLTAITLGQTVLIGKETVSYLHWCMFLSMMLFLAANENALRRITLFFGLVIITAVVRGGSYSSDSYGRLALEEDQISGFVNANDLAHMAAFFAIACLFWSLNSSKRVRPVYWTVAALQVGIILRTASRGGFLGLSVGVLLLLLLILSKKGVRLTGLALIMAGTIFVVIFSTFLVNQFEILSERATINTGREAVYSIATLGQMLENLIIGSGRGTRIVNLRITAHNTFIYTFVCYGGVAAMLYLGWVIVLARRVVKAFFSANLPINIRFMIVGLFGASLLSQILSNQAHMFYSTIFITVLIEKYRFKFTRRGMVQQLNKQ